MAPDIGPAAIRGCLEIVELYVCPTKGAIRAYSGSRESSTHPPRRHEPCTRRWSRSGEATSDIEVLMSRTGSGCSRLRSYAARARSASPISSQIRAAAVEPPRAPVASSNVDGMVTLSGKDAVSETVNVGGSSLSYDAATDTYTYVWKTD